MTREELLRSKEWWLTHIQNNLYCVIEDHMKKNGLKKKDIANKLGFSKGYITQVLNGDYDHKISKLIELSLAFGKAPIINFTNLEDYINNDSQDIITVTVSMPANNMNVLPNKGDRQSLPISIGTSVESSTSLFNNSSCN